MLNPRPLPPHPTSSQRRPPEASSAADFDATLRPTPLGFRLAKLELYNWGTFDGSVFTVYPQGQTTLLVGENGSGKSTVVDALLTLLVRPQARNYNVAAGASKNERDERTYLRGAHDRTIGPDGKPQVQYLRNGHGHYTALLASFQNAKQQTITLCQVLYLSHEGTVERIYAYDSRERSILHDLADLTSGSQLARQLRDRGFETTTSYSQYFHWFQKQTGLRAKAMDVFNQTVAVKDVQSLDHFIRHHMLERQPWNERIQKLLSHFHELSQAHQTLVRARQKNLWLAPVIDAGKSYRQHAAERDSQLQLLDATSLYFHHAKNQLLEPLCTEWQQRILFHQSELARLDQLLEKLRTESARLDVEIENASGDRLRQLPLAIDQANHLSLVKKQARLRFNDLLTRAGLPTQITSPDQFLKSRQQADPHRRQLLESRDAKRSHAANLQCEIGQLSRRLEEQSTELQSLASQKGNLPAYLVTLRNQISRDLHLAPADLPFAAELLQVNPQYHLWEASIEQVLHSFARSLLVPDSHYQRVAHYLDSKRLVDHLGQGLRLVYLKVTPLRNPHPSSSTSLSLAKQLLYRQHPLTPWVQSEIARRFDYLACESVEHFTQTHGPAMTPHRHFKTNEFRHEKDDRSPSDPRRHFILGWDNQAKRDALHASTLHLRQELQSLHSQVKSLESDVDQISRALEALDQALRIQLYDDIDFERHAFEANQLRLEQQRLLQSTDLPRDLQAKRDDLRAEALGYQRDRDQHVASRTSLEDQLRLGQRLLDRAQQQLASASQNGDLQRLAPHFAQVAQALPEPLTLENIALLPEQFERAQRQRTERLTQLLAPLAKNVTSAMSKFLRQFPEEHADLDPDIQALDSFEALYEHIAHDDLPRHEERFKNRLNEKVLHEIGLLNASLENDRQEIRDKIEQLNGALRLLEWKPSTHMRLEITDVADREILDFRRDLTNCLSGSFDLTAESNEATFLRIEKLVGKLQDENHQRWREKVADVRNWFHFAAREIVTATGESKSYYDGGTGQSGGEKGKLAFLVLVAAIAYQYDLDPDGDLDQRFHFVMVDEMFSRSDDQHAQYALDLFQQFGLQLLIVAPLDAKIRVTEPYVGTYIHVVKDRDSHRSQLFSLAADHDHD